MNKKIGLCISNKIGLDLAKFVRSQNNIDISFIATTDINPLLQDTINEFSGIEITSKKNNSAKIKELVNTYSTDIVFLLWWPFILKESTLSTNVMFVNIHPSLLPFNKGKHPYYWTIVNNTRAGVSIHKVSPDIDEGDILFQKEINYDITDTGGTIYEKSIQSISTLFKDSFQKIIAGEYIPIPQPSNIKCHYSSDLDKHSCIDLNKEYKAIDLVNIIRGRTFNNTSPSSFFYHNGKKFYITTNIREADNE